MPSGPGSMKMWRRPEGVLGPLLVTLIVMLVSNRLLWGGEGDTGDCGGTWWIIRECAGVGVGEGGADNGRGGTGASAVAGRGA